MSAAVASDSIDAELAELAAWGRRCRDWADETCRLYSMYLRRALAAAEARDLSLAEARRREVADILDAISSSAHTRLLGRKALLAYFDRLVDLELREDNPASRLQVPRMRKTLPKALSDEATERVLTVAEAEGGKVEVAVLAAFRAGLRCNELRTLQWADRRDGWLRITGKGGHTRAVPLNERLDAALRRWEQVCPSDRWVLPSPRDPHAPIGSDFVRTNFFKVGERAGVDHLIPHVGRHTFATQLLAATGDLALVQAALGHSNPATTAIYAHVRDDRLAGGVQALV